MTTEAATMFATHEKTLLQAVEATRTREYFSAFNESPSPRVYGEDAAANGKAAFESWAGQTFPVTVSVGLAVGTRGDDADEVLADALMALHDAQHRGRSVFLTGTYTGTMETLVDDFCAAFDIQRVRYETFAWEPLRAANRMLFGVDAVPQHDFSNADVTISFGADFMETWVSPIDYSVGHVQAHLGAPALERQQPALAAIPLEPPAREAGRCRCD